jgi:Virulence-associated protein E/Primase C terminal 2 (PriCT-2)/Bifunctional DNA primase/polymerase, N-terminal
MQKITKDTLAGMPKLEAAQIWFTLGYLPMPILAGQKMTPLAHQPWLDALSAKTIIDRWTANPSDDIALQCGNGLVVLDADSSESLDAMLALEEKHRVVPAMVVKTKKGVHHYFRQSPELRVTAAGHSTANHPERIDVRCGNAYIITAPSTDKVLATDEVVPFAELTYLTQAFVDDLDGHNGKQIETKTQKPITEPRQSADEPEEEKLAFLAALLDELDPDDGYSDWIQALMAVYHETDGSDEGLTLADEWSSRGSSYKGFKEVAYKWNSFGKFCGSPVTVGSLCLAVKKAGGDPVAIKAKVQEGFEPFALTETIKVAIPVQISKSRTHHGVIQPLDSSSFPHPRLRKNSSLPGTLENFKHIMESYGVHIGYDMIRKDMPITVPYLETTIDNAKNVAIAHVRNICSMNDFPVTQIHSNIVALGDLNAFNCVRQWIERGRWDGVNRLPQFRATLTTTKDYPEDFKTVVMDKWMTSALAAVFDPEFRARGVLTLSGPQGIGKTTWVNSLVNNAKLRKGVVLTGHSLDANSRDSKMTALTKWITELGEVEATLKNDLPAFKAFITNDMDVFRRPYAAEDSTMPRRTVFCASVNSQFFLKDPTGNSRFWTLRVDKVNYDHGLDMQQVFAQYKEEFYDKGATWWLNPEEEARLTVINREFETISPVQESLTTLIEQGRSDGKDCVFMSATQLLKAIGIDRPNRTEVLEVHTVMTELVGAARKTSGNRGWAVPVCLEI